MPEDFMKRYFLICTYILAIIPVCAFSEDFTIEDKSLATLPKPIEAAIRSAKGFNDASCNLVGKPIDLLGHGINTGYVATTSHACDWGAALGPIWIVRNKKQPVTVLAHVGYSLTLENQLQRGLRNVVISAATAGWSTESQWQFDGIRYIKVKERADTNAETVINDSAVQAPQDRSSAPHTVRADDFLITVANLKAIKNPRLFLGSVKATSNGAKIIAFSVSSADVSTFMRLLNEAGEAQVILVEINPTTVCGNRLVRSVIEIGGTIDR